MAVEEGADLPGAVSVPGPLGVTAALPICAEHPGREEQGTQDVP